MLTGAAFAPLCGVLHLVMSMKQILSSSCVATLLTTCVVAYVACAGGECPGDVRAEGLNLLQGAHHSMRLDAERTESWGTAQMSGKCWKWCWANKDMYKSK